jgi:hypothetical protein
VDFLALEELKVSFQERYRAQMAVSNPVPETAKASTLDGTFGQRVGQSERLYSDNYE